MSSFETVSTYFNSTWNVARLLHKSPENLSPKVSTQEVSRVREDVTAAARSLLLGRCGYDVRGWTVGEWR